VALAYGFDENKLLSIAENLRIAIQNMEMDGYRKTVSIGVAYCGNQPVQNYEKIIDQADNAVYAAKHSGRNTVCLAFTN
jgi:diguanylate cyclase (GGDEF)-like protein